MAMRLQHIRSLPALVLVLGGAVAVSCAEIMPMTRERVAEAEIFGRKAVKDDSIVPTETCRTRAKFGLHMFDITITTPFASVAYAVFASKQKGDPLDLAGWPIEPAGNQSVIVSADPAALFPDGLPPAPPVSVRTIVLRRGDQVIEPRRSDTHEVQFPGLAGKSRTFRGGAFYFPLESFASEKGDLEIVVIPEIDQPGAEAVLKLKKAELARLR
jgi:hypothetical protein